MEETTITSLADYTALETSLHTLAGRAKNVTEPDKKLRIELRDARVWLEKTGKFLRDDYNRLAKDVIAKEKELIGIIAPAEEALKSLEDAVEAEKERLYRVSRFEERSERLGAIGVTLEAGVSVLMDDKAFEVYFQEQQTAVNAQKQAELEARERKVREEEERQAKLKRDEEWAEKIRAEEKAKAEQAVKDAEARAQRAEQDAKDKADRDERDRIQREADAKAEKERKEAEEKKKIEADIAYQLWLESLGYTKEDDASFVIENNGKTVRLSKVLGYYTIE